jgi:hypothetical protein
MRVGVSLHFEGHTNGTLRCENNALAPSLFGERG